VRKIWETDGGNAIYVFHGTGRNINWQVPWFAKTVLHTPNIGTFGFTGSRATCHASAARWHL
jgi:hypothetical protein